MPKPSARCTWKGAEDPDGVIRITLRGARRALGLPGDHFGKSLLVCPCAVHLKLIQSGSSNIRRLGLPDILPGEARRRARPRHADASGRFVSLWTDTDMHMVVETETERKMGVGAIYNCHH